jgi:hypothetical protein
MSGFIGDNFPSVLGGGIPGGQPLGGLLGGGAGGGRSGASGMEGGGARSTDREQLRRVLSYSSNLNVITPFRKLMNAGDPAGTKNSYPSPSAGPITNQVNGSTMVGRLHASGGGTRSGEAFFSGNQRFVYDGSDYVRFKKLLAKNKTYNDATWGGDGGGSTVKQALRRVRN